MLKEVFIVYEGLDVSSVWSTKEKGRKAAKELKTPGLASLYRVDVDKINDWEELEDTP